MLERLVSELTDFHGGHDSDWSHRLVEELLDRSDHELLRYLELESQDTASPAAALARKLRLRRLYKPIYERFEYQLGPHASLVQDRYSPGRPSDDDPTGNEGGLSAARRRLDAVRQLEQDFGLPPLSVVMYCPPKQMNTKIADVRILTDGVVTKLSDYEDDPRDVGLTGGHLSAQKRRFRRLWRVYFACDADVKQKLDSDGQLIAMRHAIAALVLGTRDDAGRSPEEAALTIAKELRDRGHPNYVDADLALTVGQRKGSGAPTLYPSGAPTLRSLVQ